MTHPTTVRPRTTPHTLAILTLTLLITACTAALAQQPQPATELPTLTPQLVEKARQTIVDASLGENPALRSNAIEAASVEPNRALPLVTRGLSDPNPGVRFAAVVTAGRLKLNQLTPAIQPLTQDPNPSVKAAALFALHNTGQRINISPLARMLQDPDPRLRANVALLIGLMGDITAVPMLRDAAQAPMARSVSADQAAVVRVQIAEAIARLDPNAAPDDLRAGAYSPFGEVQVLAINAMGAIHDRRMERALVEFLQNPPVETQLAAAASLARLDNPQGLPVTLRLASHADPVVRSQAAWALGWFANSPTIYPTLQKLLQDPSPQVQTAAAASVLRRYADQRPPS